ncbi:MAG: spore maturation protein [Oscillospiraceae bacterium]|nr:spore maturation protein [Oscillospiraceae bacterium]
MNSFSSLIVPLILTFIGLYGIYRKVDIYDALVAGATEGLATVAKIAPSVVALFVAIHMLRASGALEFICSLLSPIASFSGLPPENLPLALLRPLSGSAALAIGRDIMANTGADSFPGRIAAVMLGASETTFYTIAVYFGALRLKGTRHAIPAALAADLAGFVASALAVKIFFA